MKNFFPYMLIAAALSACGGGSDNQINFDTAPIKVFSDGAGVGSVSYTSSGQSGTGYVVSPELAAILAEIEGTQEISDLDLDGISVVPGGTNVTVREGAVIIDGISLNVTALSTTEDDVIVTFFQEPTTNISLFSTEGPLAMNVPNSGLVTYTGLMRIGQRSNSSYQLGTFEADANFDAPNPSVSFDGLTASYSVTGSATISGGSFSSSTMDIDGPLGSVEGSLRGDFHDVDAADMAGVIYSNDSSGTYVGAFVGSN